MQSAFQQLRRILIAASACTKPDTKSFSDLLGPLSKGVGDIIHVSDANRKEREWFNHLKCIAEGAPAFGWVQVVCCDYIPSEGDSKTLNRT